MITLPFVYFSNTLCSLKNIYYSVSLYARASVTPGRNGMFSKQSRVPGNISQDSGSQYLGIFFGRHIKEMRLSG